LGACAGCPHLSETIGKGIEPVFLREFNFIHQVKVNSPG
jgi:Fe-S cluster biogenesis protein NfuA